MRITGLKKKLISLIVAVIMTVSGMYVENINIDSSFACEDTANQNFTQAAHLSRPSESCTEELLGTRETGRIAAGWEGRPREETVGEKQRFGRSSIITGSSIA